MNAQNNPFLEFNLPLFQSCVQGSFNQNDPRFGDSAGIQCACNTLTSICWSVNRRVKIWKSFDLDYILIKGNEIFEAVNLNRSLYFDELPKEFKLAGTDITVEFSKIDNGFLRERFNSFDVFLNIDFFFSDNSNGAILFFQGYTISLLKDDSKNIYIFDSHSRDDHGQPSPEGKSILMTFLSADEVERYVLETYKATTHIQIVYVKVNPLENKQKMFLLKAFSQFKKQIKNKAIYKIQYVKRKNTEELLEEQSILNLYTKKRKEQSKSNYLKNAEQRKKQFKLNYIKNGEQRKKQFKLNYIKNAEKEREHSKLSYVKNTSQRKLRRRLNYLKNIGLQKKRSKESYNKNFENRKNQFKTYKKTKNDAINKVKKFKLAILQGPYFICVCCNRSLYKRSVKIFKEEKYKILCKINMPLVSSFESCYYICNTCDRKLCKNEIPAQCVLNKLELYDFPDHLMNISKLERVLISQRILFSKVSIMPKGQFPKIKGTICNIPIQTESVCQTLPRTLNESNVLFIKLKKKLSFKSHVFSEAVRPGFILQVLNHLKSVNPLYRNINIKQFYENTVSNDFININFVDFIVTNKKEPGHITFVSDDSVQMIIDHTNDDDEFENADPLNKYRSACNETVLVSKCPHVIADEENIIIAPGEGKTPLFILKDEKCEEMAHPHLFPHGKFGLHTKRDVKLTHTKYFNQRLLNYTQKFASDPDYIFLQTLYPSRQI